MLIPAPVMEVAGMVKTYRNWVIVAAKLLNM